MLPEKYGSVNSRGCLSITSKEFIAVGAEIEWLFRNGFCIVLDDDSAMNNKVFELLSTGEFPNYRKVWCCKPSTRITSKNRTINEFLNCRSCSLGSI